MKLKNIDVDWVTEFKGAVTVCDLEGTIVYMNNTSIDQFENDGGEELIGSNLLDCHPEPARTKLAQLLKNPEDNMYSVEKRGIKKIIYQTPWKENGEMKGLVEISFQLVPGMPHFIRG